MFSGKVRITIQRCHVKRNVNELKVSSRKSFAKKKSPLLQLHISYQSTVHKGTIAINIGTILATCSRHKLFLHLSCLKYLRSKYLSSYLPLRAGYFFLLLSLLTQGPRHKFLFGGGGFFN